MNSELFLLPLHPLLRQSGIGRMVEWSITVVLKTTVPRGTGGSNPSPSASARDTPLRQIAQMGTRKVPIFRALKVLKKHNAV